MMEKQPFAKHLNALTKHAEVLSWCTTPENQVGFKE
jgi:hypothetical protein